MRLHVLYDNEAAPGYEADWGFSCLVKGGEWVLFDTGAKPEVLEHNMRAAGLAPGEIDRLVISHDHWDHTGGLPYLAQNNPGLEVYILPSFGETMRTQVGSGRLHEVKGPSRIAEGVYSTGPVRGPMNEQALVVEARDGVYLLTGCAHPGVDELMQPARQWGPIAGILGGFHGFDRFDALEGVAYLGPCHCTRHTEAIAERFPESFHRIQAGTKLEV